MSSKFDPKQQALRRNREDFISRSVTAMVVAWCILSSAEGREEEEEEEEALITTNKGREIREGQLWLPGR
jgi:hypothetical protein